MRIGPSLVTTPSLWLFCRWTIHNVVQYSSFYYHHDRGGLQCLGGNIILPPPPPTYDEDNGNGSSIFQTCVRYSRVSCNGHCCIAVEVCPQDSKYWPVATTAMDRRYYPTTNLSLPLLQVSCQITIAPYERVVRTRVYTWPSGYDVDKCIISVSHTLNMLIQCVIHPVAFSTDI